MSFNLSAGNDGDDLAPLAEINVTPMVDVMLVLLIIFMVAAPMLSSGMKVDLPQAKEMNSETQPITISVNQQGQIFLQETEIPIDEVVAKLTAIAAAGASRSWPRSTSRRWST